MGVNGTQGGVGVNGTHPPPPPGVRNRHKFFPTPLFKSFKACNCKSWRDSIVDNRMRWVGVGVGAMEGLPGPRSRSDTPLDGWTSLPAVGRASIFSTRIEGRSRVDADPCGRDFQ